MPRRSIGAWEILLCPRQARSARDRFKHFTRQCRPAPPWRVLGTANSFAIGAIVCVERGDGVDLGLSAILMGIAPTPQARSPDRVQIRHVLQARRGLRRAHHAGPMDFTR
jgi:hypothetical protein